jgi:hypothetical protein
MKTTLRNLLIVGLLFVFTNAASACPSCQAALAADGGKYVGALFWSILFMISVPFTIVGVFAFLAYRITHPKQPTLPAAQATATAVEEHEEEFASV